MFGGDSDFLDWMLVDESKQTSSIFDQLKDGPLPQISANSVAEIFSASEVHHPTSLPVKTGNFFKTVTQTLSPINMHYTYAGDGNQWRERCSRQHDYVTTHQPHLGPEIAYEFGHKRDCELRRLNWHYNSCNSCGTAFCDKVDHKYGYQNPMQLNEILRDDRVFLTDPSRILPEMHHHQPSTGKTHHNVFESDSTPHKSLSSMVQAKIPTLSQRTPSAATHCSERTINVSQVNFYAGFRI